MRILWPFQSVSFWDLVGVCVCFLYFMLSQFDKLTVTTAEKRHKKNDQIIESQCENDYVMINDLQISVCFFVFSSRKSERMGNMEALIAFLCIELFLIFRLLLLLVMVRKGESIV